MVMFSGRFFPYFCSSVVFRPAWTVAGLFRIFPYGGLLKTRPVRKSPPSLLEQCVPGFGPEPPLLKTPLQCCAGLPALICAVLVPFPTLSNVTRGFLFGGCQEGPYPSFFFQLVPPGAAGFFLFTPPPPRFPRLDRTSLSSSPLRVAALILEESSRSKSTTSP